MTNEQIQVKEFMEKFGQETPSKPCIPSLEIRKLRAKLILEEALETITALGFKYIHLLILNEFLTEDCIEVEPNLIEIADGLADLHYVGYCGTAIACGLDMEPIFAEVHHSNMSKLWTLRESQTYPKNDLSFIDVVFPEEREDGKHILAKNKDGKVIKSPSFSPPNLKSIIDNQQ